MTTVAPPILDAVDSRSDLRLCGSGFLRTSLPYRER
jgi:hypothetical protein